MPNFSDLFKTTKIMPPAKRIEEQTGYVASYDRTNSLNIAPGTSLELLNLRVPQGLTFILKRFGNDITQYAGWTFVYWNIKRNGISVPAYGNIYNQLGNAQQLREMIEDNEFRGGDVLSITGTNTDTVATFEVLASIQGEFRRRG